MNKRQRAKLAAMDKRGMHQLERVYPLLDEWPKEERNIQWLEHALQSAVSVEFSTIPPYLSALWSIKNELDPVAKSIRNIVQEEMLHMALACNMLTAIGCVPKIGDPNMVPSYPGKIPGGVHPELTVTLSGLSDKALDAFIEIEAPTGHEQGKADKTIGEFYNAIRGAFKTLKPELCAERQVTGPLSYMVMEDLAAVERGIDLILDQGEGSEKSPEVGHTNELAHYYRFLEIKNRKRLSGLDADRNPVFDGAALDFPEVWPMAVVPDGGYLQKDVTPEVWKLIDDIDQTFTQLLNRLQAVWEFGDQGALVHAIETMFGLSEKARSLMSHEIEKGSNKGNYGPCFRYLEGKRTEQT